MSWLRLGKRLLLTLLLLVGLLLVLLLAAIGYLAGTQSGLQHLVSAGERWAPGTLRVARANGSLLDSVTLRGLSYRQGYLTLEAQRLHLAWNPLALFSGRLEIEALDLWQPRITLPPSRPEPVEPQPPLFPIQLPEIDLPLALQIGRIRVSELRLDQAGSEESAPALVIDQALLGLRSKGKALVIDRLQVEAPQGSISLKGQLTPTPTLPMLLELQWQATVPQQATLHGAGLISGDLDQLHLQQSLSGLLQAELSATLEQLLKSPTGTLSISHLQLGLGQFSPALQGSTLQGTAEIQGSLQGAQVEGQWQAQLPELGDTQLALKANLDQEKLALSRLTLRAPANDTQLELSGLVSDLTGTPQLAVDGHWSNLVYPPGPAPDYQSPQGSLSLKGPLHDYQLALSAHLAGTQIPAGQWRLSAQGSDQGFKAVQLAGDTLEGELSASGQVTWLPQPTWDLQLNGQEINPGSHWPDWPGRLSLALETQGSLPPNQPLQLRAQVQKLSGTLRDQPLSGNANLEVLGQTLKVEALQLQALGSRLQASGQVGEQVDLDWALQATDLERVLAGAGGTLTGQGALRGPLQQLHLTAELSGERLRLPPHQVAGLEASLDLDLSGQQRSHLRLNAETLELAGQRWQSLSLQGGGTPDDHQLDLALNEGPVESHLMLTGAWQAPAWSGVLTRADIRQEQAGHWLLQGATPLQASADSVQTEQLCWARTPAGSGELCLQAAWSAGEGADATLQLSGLPLTLLDPWLPAGTEIEGELALDASVQQTAGEPPRVQALARLSSSELLLDDEALSVVSGPAELLLDGTPAQLDATLTLPLQQPAGRIGGELQLLDLADSARLRGTLESHLSDLKFVSLFAPQLQGVAGTLDSKLNVTGTLQEPRVQGHLALTGARAELPALGLVLEDTQLRIQDKPGSNELTLSGSTRSGEGTLSLDGSFDPLARRGSLAINGERVQAVATREVKAWISPALQIDASPTLIQVRGEVVVPEAGITPPKVAASGTPVSADVVILDKDTPPTNEPAQAARLDARVRLTLGDKVQVDAFGFSGRLQGSILVEDDGRRATRATGSMQVAAGQYRIYGQDLNIQRGSLVFSGGPVDNPGLDLRIAREVEEVTAGARVSGTLRQPQLSLFSDPSMPESSLLSYLLLGRPPGAETTTPSEQAMLLKAASALTMKGGNALADRLSEAFNIDDLGLDSGDSLNETSLYIGKYLSPRLYIKYGMGLLEPTTTFFMRYRLSQHWSLESETGTNSSGGDLIYTIER